MPISMVGLDPHLSIMGIMQTEIQEPSGMRIDLARRLHASHVRQGSPQSRASGVTMMLLAPVVRLGVMN
ncbi:MAG: hypothetical protein QOH31_4183 [Verrucomicrobiota bacterium]|jgi:hypothetical protein